MTMTQCLTEGVVLPRVIGLAGAARSGKDTAARYLINEWGYRSYALADPLRWGLREMFGLTWASYMDERKEQSVQEYPEWPAEITPRYLMQTLGTEWARELIHPDVWLHVADRRICEFPRVVVTDIRFENEAEWVRHRGLLIHLRRESAPSVRDHVSEAGVTLLDTDVEVSNDGSREQLYRTLGCVMRAVADTQQDSGPEQIDTQQDSGS